MANKLMKHSKNVNGKWYCTSSADDSGEGCIACGVCYGSLPSIFAEDENGEAYVTCQPSNPDEVSLAQEQMDACPIGAIGNDG